MANEDKRKGRPPRGEAAAAAWVKVRVTPAEAEHLNEVSAALGMTLSELTRAGWKKMTEQADALKGGE